MNTNDPYALVTPAPSFTLRSDDLVDGGEKPLAMRDPHLGGKDASPHLTWSGFPPETQSFAITCYDPDAPTGIGFMHWATANIPASVTSVATGAGSPDGGMPEGTLTLPNDVRVRGYVGANPPAGSGRHRYVFIVHAVDVPRLDIDPDLTPTVLGFNLHFHTLARAVLTVWVDATA
ncbi:MAG TPA: YbhB/YbcL family Raf kinase inhibitor-like protein [Microbacterium sp.]|uniref:YbhB/YbcL family Raf kinase inhibitor-like protein n=1 Tax=Microbacterium TaxID=33882 RepID=UPI002856CC42|nr:YbhB/YbcL family Raf kinase inhibitor-like protein [Microbacterium trichothecenolyticum]MDR7110905.1 Raf kinase inhibitor-like YbhB/YbcL family protein [Microbacterium trichothecenolyticum]